MQVGVPREQIAGERRVALTPEVVSSLVSSGVTVAIEAGAGERAGHSDAAYQEVGAVIAADRLALRASSDVLVHVQHPSAVDVTALREHTVVIGFLQPLLALDLVRQLRDRRITSFSMDAIPRIARAQDMDALSSMSTISGYRAVILASAALPRFFPLLMTAAGVVTPARVFVLGAGVAGVVITTALVPGKRAPILVTADAVFQMRPGSVIVDLAAEAGGNCALTRPGEVSTVRGVTIIGTTNPPSQMPGQASQMYARNLFNLLQSSTYSGSRLLSTAQRIEDDGDVQGFLQERTERGGNVAKGRDDHQHATHPHANPDALFGDHECAFADSDGIGDPADVIGRQHHISRFRRNGRTAHAHGNADCGRGQGRSVINTVANHRHDRMAGHN